MAHRICGPQPEWGMKHFHCHSHPFEEFPALTHVHEVICDERHKIGQHIHETFEISYIHAGRGYWNAEGQTYHLKPGDIYIIRPGEIHGGHTDPADPYHVFVLGIDPSALPIMRSGRSKPQLLAPPRSPEVLRRIEDTKAHGVPVFDAPAKDVSQAVAEAEVLNDEFRALQQRVIPGGAGLEAPWRRLLAELDTVPADEKARSLKLMMAQALIIELLVSIARVYSAHHQQVATVPLPPAEREDIRRLQIWLSTRLGNPPSLSEMAEHAGMSPAHLAVVFKQDTGLTPLEYMTGLRIEEAARRLRAPGEVSVTDVALELGFSSSQYFSLVFKKVKGCTPTEFREQA
ncbi:MAG TPA: AraC family transcriptional regulator [Planctomycetota bacterium]|nr:AraC family transcriptional regulator [Planctomycetota bacterium]